MEETREHPAVERPRKGRRNLLDASSMPGLADIDFDPPRARIESKAADPDTSVAEATGPRSGTGQGRPGSAIE